MGMDGIRACSGLGGDLMAYKGDPTGLTMAIRDLKVCMGLKCGVPAEFGGT